MSKTLPPARHIKYADLNEMLADVESLLQNGYEPKGNWTLGQATSHVADWMRFPMDGFPKPPLFMRAIFGAMKMTGMATRMANQILEGGFKPGVPTAPQTVPDPDAVSDQQGVDELRRVITQLQGFQGELHPSPLFGQMDLPLHTRVSLLHGAHHFGYLVPKNDQAE